MSLSDLVRAYFAYPAIQAYLLLGTLGAALAVHWVERWWMTALAAAAAVLLYPLVWYGLHRFVLHGSFLYKSRLTAPVWKRIHFDHHRDPHDLRVLFGSLANTLPTILFVSGPLGWAIDGRAGAAGAMAASLFTTCFYEFCHCIQHLAYEPKLVFLKRIKRLHLAHHFHNEAGNFGITSFAWDRILGTYYGRPAEMPKSATVFNLGYAGDAAQRWPWVARLTEDWGRPRKPRRASDTAASA
jgi:sterol desaturase/sphingolipid hydroxylase (fatty acid hydroxylase superfamily)